MRICSTAKCIAVVLLFAAMPVQRASAFDRLKAIQNIQSNDLALQEEGARQILENRQGIISALLTLIEQTPKKIKGSKRNNVLHAMNTLGQMRATEAVELLVDYMDFPRPSKGLTADSIPLPDKLYPAVGALIRIGRPSIPPILGALENGRGEERVFLLLARWTVYRIEGGRAEAIFRLESELEKAKSSERKAVIRKLLEYTKEIWSKNQ